MFFEVKIQRVNEEEKTVKETYLVDDISFAEVDKHCQEHLQVSADDILSIKRSVIAETYYDNSEGDYYRAKVIRTYLDDENGKEKVSNWYILARFKSTEDATKGFAEILRSYQDMVLADVIHTKIVELI